MLITSPKQSLPPGGFVTKPLYHEDIFALPAAPGLELLVIIRFRAPAVRAGCPYFSRRLFIQLLPVFVVPAGSYRHCILLITYAILSHRRPGGHGLFLPLSRRAFPSPTPGHISAWLRNLYGLRQRRPLACFPFPGLSGQ